MTLTELAYAMGYKGITSKLTKTVDEMLSKGTLEKTAKGYLKYFLNTP